MTTVLVPPQKVAIENIQWQDKATMARADMNADAVKACAERWSEASSRANPFESSPEPITLFLDNEGKYWVGDGRHRIAGAVSAKRTMIEAVVNDGTKWDALEYALKCNTENGTSYTPRDNTLRIKKMHALHSEWSDTKMAKELKVSASTISRVRSKLSAKDTEVAKQVKEDAAKAATAPAPKSKPEAAKAQAAIKGAVRAAAAKAKPSKPKAAKEDAEPDTTEPKGGKVTDSQGVHGKQVEAALANIAKIDEEIQRFISGLVKQFDLRNEITGEGTESKSHYAAIVAQMDQVILEWKAWKKNG